MSQNTHDRKHRSSCFLGCFGFSAKGDEEKKLSAGGGGGSGKHIYGGERMSDCWLFRRRKNSSAKTVPVNNSKFPTNLRSRKEIQVLNKNMNLHGTGSDQILAAGGGGGGGNSLNKVVAAEPGQSGLHRSSQVMSPNNGEHIILEKTKSLEGEKGTKTRHTSSRSTRKRSTKSVSAEPGMYPNENDAKFGSLVGISILMVILGIVIIWGKLCAIFCTSICFYMRAQQRNESNNKKGAPKEQLDGWNEKEHNRKVVLQGLVERSKRHM